MILAEMQGNAQTLCLLCPAAILRCTHAAPPALGPAHLGVLAVQHLQLCQAGEHKCGLQLIRWLLQRIRQDLQVLGAHGRHNAGGEAAAVAPRTPRHLSELGHAVCEATVQLTHVTQAVAQAGLEAAAPQVLFITSEPHHPLSPPHLLDLSGGQLPLLRAVKLAQRGEDDAADGQVQSHAHRI